MWKTVRSLRSIQTFYKGNQIRDAIPKDLDKSGQKIIEDAVKARGPFYVDRSFFIYMTTNAAISEAAFDLPVKKKDWRNLIDITTQSTNEVLEMQELISDCISKGFISEDNDGQIVVSRPTGVYFSTILGLVNELFFTDSKVVWAAVYGAFGGIVLTLLASTLGSLAHITYSLILNLHHMWVGWIS